MTHLPATLTQATAAAPDGTHAAAQSDAAPTRAAGGPRRGFSVGQKLAASLGVLGLAVALVGRPPGSRARTRGTRRGC